MSQTKKLYKIIEDYTDDGVFGNILDSATNTALKKHFYFRNACDDDEKFIFYFQRNLEELKRRYDLQLALEGEEYNPLVIDLKTRSVSATKSGSVSDTVTKTLNTLDSWEKLENTSKASSISGTAESDGTSSGSASYSDSHDNTRTDNLTESSSGTNDGRELHSDTPQANVSAATVGGVGDPITWTYASDIRDTHNANNNTTTDTGTVTDDYDAKGSSNNSTTTHGETSSTQSGTEDVEKTNSDKLAKTGTITDARSRTDGGEETQKENIEGRSGHLISEILHDWEIYIRDTDAFKWLCKQLEICFMPNLLYDEEDI